MARNLNFDGSSRRIPVQNLDVGNRNVMIAPRIEIEEMGTLGLPSYPYKRLPILRIADEYVSGDRAYEKPVVLVKGTIVSLLTDQTTIAAIAGVDGAMGNMVNPAASGELPVYNDAIDGGIVDQYIDESPYGYSQEVVSLVVPANGGAAATYSYTALDDQFGEWTTSTDNDLIVGANVPLGVVYHDVYMDLRGSALNYELQDAVGVAAKGFITIPFANSDAVDNNIASGGKTMGSAAGGEGYAAVYKKYQFYTFDGSATPSEANPGALVMSDVNGRFVVQSAAVNAVPNVQTVGKVLATDSRFPKELMDEIRAYPLGGMNIPNVKTAGIPADLYAFAKDIMTAVDSAPSAADIRDAIRSGAFGYVRIQFKLA